MDVVVVPHDPDWSARFAAEADSICGALEGVDVEIHHIGSTAIPGIFAKPIIDILLVVPDPGALDIRTSSMVGLGYEAMGEFGIPGRRYFRKNSAAGGRTHQVHAFGRGSVGATRHLAFRDYMIAHVDAAQAYSRLKRRLAAEFACDIEAYMDGKDDFIKRHEVLALEWLARGRRDD